MKLTKKQLKQIIKEALLEEEDKTPYMDMTKYELDDLSTDRQMVVLLKEVVAHQVSRSFNVGKGYRIIRSSRRKASPWPMRRGPPGPEP